MKKIVKILTAFFAIGFLGLQYLANVGVISINYLELEKWAISMFGETSALQGLLITLISQNPFGVGFAGGLVLGLNKG